MLRWSLVCCLLLVVLVTATPSVAQQSKRAPPAAKANEASRSPCGDGVYFLGEMTSDQAGQGQLDDVVGQLLKGVRDLSAGTGASAQSIYELRRINGAMRDAQIVFDDHGGNADFAYRALKSVWKGSTLEVGIVKTDLRLINEQYYLNVSLQCVGPSKPKIALWRKTVRIPAGRLQDLRDAAARVGREIWVDSAEPQISISAPTKPRVGELVTIDAASTSDPDDDELFTDWTVPRDAPLVHRSGSQLTFVATKAAVLHFEVRAKEVAGESRSVTSAVDIEILPTAEVSVTGGGFVEMADGQRANLAAAGHCSGTDHCAWVQVSGPIIALPAEVVDGDLPLEVAVDQPGAYALALVGRSEAVTVRKEVSFVVAPKPAVLIYAPSRALYGYQYEINGRASYDASGQPLRYRWEVGPTAFPDPASCGCAPRANTDHAIILTEGSESIAHLQFAGDSKESRTIYVRLTVTAERKVGNDTISVQACEQHSVYVHRRWVYVYSSAGPVLKRPVSDPSYDGVRMNIGAEGTVIDGTSLGSFGVGVFTHLLRSDPHSGQVRLGGGTSIEAIWYLTSMISLHGGAFAKTYNGFTVGPDASIDLRCPFGFLGKAFWAYNVSDREGASKRPSAAESSLAFMVGWGHAL